MTDSQQRDKMQSAPGFLAALDQSGGSTPGALRLYGIEPDSYSSDTEMFDLVHAMRTRIMTSPAFTGDHILGAILFEDTMDREIAGQPTARYLWERKQIVPFLKVDKGLEAEQDGVQLMKPMPGLTEMLDRATAAGVFGTKMRSVVKRADPQGVEALVAQQFTVGRTILAGGLVPIIEPEVDIASPDKAQSEQLVTRAIVEQLERLGPDQSVMLKLTLPEDPTQYRELTEHRRVLKVVALSGGYSRTEANRRLALAEGVVASFSRALAEGLSVGQSDEEFDSTLATSIESIFEASGT